MDTIREFTLKVGSGRKISCHTRELNLSKQCAGPMFCQLSYIPTSQFFFFFSSFFFQLKKKKEMGQGLSKESQQEQKNNFLIQSQLCVLTLIWCLFHPHVTAAACKRPQSFCKKCRWQVKPNHAYTPDPMKSKCAMSLSRHSTGTHPEMSSHTTCQGTFSQPSQLTEPMQADPGIESGISVYKLISTKKKKKAQVGNKWSNILPKSLQARKKPPPLVCAFLACL